MRIIILLITFFSMAFANAQTIPATHLMNWSIAGYQGNTPVPSVIFDITNFGGVGDSLTDNYAAIQSAIDSLHGIMGVIYFPPGNYIISSTLNLPDSVILRGESPDSTHLLFNFNGVVSNAINITGTVDVLTSVTSGYCRGSNYITVVNPATFNIGDYAEIQQANGNWDIQPAPWAGNSIGQILHINNISSDTLFFDNELRINYNSNLNPEVRKIIPRHEIGIECLSISRMDSITTGLCINIYFNYAANCWIHGVESSKSIGSHIEADASTNLTISGCYIHHSFQYDGTSTHGYGLTLFQHTGECLIENNIMKHLRHSFSLQTGANGNVIAYNYSLDPNRSEFPANYGADISLHGHFPYSNLFEGNIVQNIMIDQTWGPSGPFNTFFRNRAELYGIIMTSGTVESDSLTFVGNEITNMSPLMGNYILFGNGHFEFANNVRGVITPAGATALPDTSLYLSSVPAFWNAGPFPSIGMPNAFGSGTIPAYQRYQSGTGLTSCSDTIINSVKSIVHGRVSIFPNPALNGVTIRSEGFIASVVISDITGRIVMENYFDKTSSIQRLNFNLKSGLYFVIIKNDSKEYTEKLLVTKTE
jgi:hypothetical protein